MSYKDFMYDGFDEKTGELNLERVKENFAKEKANVNILLMGKTGVGKSSLVNAVFGEEIAKTGVGSPVTQNLEKYELKEKGLTLWDTKGIEAKDYEDTRLNVFSVIKETFESLNKNNVPHVAWLCIKEPSKRIEDCDIELLKLTKSFDIPTIVVFTDTEFEAGDEFVSEAQKIINEKNKLSGFIKDRYIRVNSVEYSFRGTNVTTEGLDELVALTLDCLEESNESVKKHFKTIQRVNNKVRLEAMKDNSTKVVNWASAAAATAGASPIPGSDAPIIAGIQSTMIYKINSHFDVSLETSASTTLITGILGTTALASVGKTIVGNILKFIPIAGSIAGATISATTAAALTKAIGEAYIAVLEHYYNVDSGEVELPEGTTALLDMFKTFFNPVKS